MLSLIFATVFTAATTCYGAIVHPGDGVPYGAQPDGNSAVHVTALLDGQRVVGWIYQDVDASLWFSSAFEKTTTNEEAVRLLTLAGSKGMHDSPLGYFGAIVRTNRPALERFRGFTSVRCY